MKIVASLAVLLALAGPAFAQHATDAGSEDAPAALIFDGAPPPVPPAVAARDERGRVTLRATRLERPLQIDGRMDDEVYGATQPIDYFEQQVPREGQAATE